MDRRRWLWFGAATVGLIVLSLLLLTLHPGVRYVATAATWQAELLRGRVPVEQAIASGAFSPDQVARLRQVPEIKAFAKDLGLADTGHYTTIHPGWRQTVWNVSACEPLAFEPRTWWFPIVGTVPYLGFFEEAEARSQEVELRERGLDVYVRTAGAWSTLGWFEDPLLPEMATWDESRLANTLFHELTHATVWIPGSVAFNESLASFVGDEATLRYLRQKYGASSPEVEAEVRRRADREVYLRLLHDVYGELDLVYQDVGLTQEQKLKKKTDILASLPGRAHEVGFSDPARWEAFLAREPWNNARIVQFRVYNRSPAWFAAVLASEGEDLGAFLRRIQTITAGTDEPYRAVGQAAGVAASELDDTLR